LVLVGSTTGTSYGRRCPKGEWNDHFLAEIKNEYDPSKVHFTGSLPYAAYIELLQRSSVHVYLTYPFVLSWSLLEAMSCGCAVVGSDTAPVREVIEPERNGLLVDFFDPQALASSIASLVKDRDRAAALGRAARQTVLDHYELNACLQQHLALIKLVASGGLEP
jgi:glycosyltransferase involved in cell wall biosynthesis